MDFTRINPRLSAEKPSTYHVQFGEEKLFHNGQPIEMDFKGVESAVGRRAAAHMVKSSAKKTDSKGNVRNAKDMSVDEILNIAGQTEHDRAEFYARLLTGWRNVPYLPDDQIENPDAVPTLLECSHDNALMLFTSRPWMLDGIDAFLSQKQQTVTTI